MYPTQLDNSKLGVMDAGIFGELIGAGIGAIGGALNAGQRRKEKQFEVDNAYKQQENQFLANNPNFEQKAAFKRRLLGNLGDSFVDTPYGAGAPGTPGYGTISRLDPRVLFSKINAGQFGQDLRGAGTADIARPDFTAPQVPGGGFKSFLGDLLAGFGGGVMSGGFGGGGGGGSYPSIPVQGGGWDLKNNLPGM